MTIGARIAQYRKQAGLSQEALAEQLGVSRQSVSKWESGGVMPDLDKVLAMSALFGVSTDALLKETPAEAPEETPEESSEDLPEPPLAEETIEEVAEEIADKIAEEPLAAAAEPPEKSEGFPAPAPQAQTPAPGKGKRLRRVLAAVLAAALLIAAIAVPLYFGGVRETWWALNGGKVQYPYVLVSGMGGWGDGVGINATLPYWGAGTGSLAEYLTQEGYTVTEATVGPFSSAWDRACELYAQLTGATVDYGAAHAKAHNHARFGRTYTEARVPQWGEKINGGQRVKINLVGHSFGGATVRLLTALLANGDAAEQAATGKDTSPLFTGGKADWVHSVTALCAPHNGSSLTCILEEAGGLLTLDSATELLASVVYAVGGLAAPADETYDFMLDQFGITGPVSLQEAYDIVTSSGTDNVAYDLSPDGAAALNARIGTAKGIYYFSYAYTTTRKGALLGGQVPLTGTLPVLMPTAFAMGSYTGTTPGGIVIDESWQENDGLVSVVSAQYPTGDPHADLPEDASAFETGVWYVAPTRSGDHGTVIGLQAAAEPTHRFYDTLFEMIDGLRR
ncbi:MAG: helix-turn-helix domain-containing protein [Clostridia bacterium]|nr:helix-turn-helix domain-containing protein [Clostridia bacterium]